MRQVEALNRVKSPFVTALMGSFQDSRALYICLEYMRGPDLFAYIHEMTEADGSHQRPTISAVQARKRRQTRSPARADMPRHEPKL